MSFNQVSLLIAEIDRVLALNNTQTLPNELVKSEMCKVLLRLRDYLETSSVGSIPSSLQAQLETMITTQVELKKQQLQNLAQQQQSLTEEIYHLDNQKRGLIDSFTKPQPTHQEPEATDVFQKPENPLGSPMIIQEQTFQAWIEDKIKPSASPLITPSVESSDIETPIETIKALTDLLEPEHRQDLNTTASSWFLGIDFGTCGISGVLFNGSNYEQYPLYWLTDEGESFRLPVQAKAHNSSFIVGFDTEKYSLEDGILLEKFKPFFDLAIPYYDGQSNQWLPTINQFKIPFYTLLNLTTELLSIIKKESETMAIDLSPEGFLEAIENLQGVIINCPSHWSDTYRFNLREAILQAELVHESAQIFFLEEAIASLISRCPAPPGNISGNPTLLLINFGATTTELALVSLPENLTELTYSDFTIQSLTYGGEDLEQDIFIELVYPHFNYLNPPLIELDLDLPEVAEINPQKRQLLRLALQNKPIGKSILNIAKQVNFILQQETEFTCKIGGAPWRIKRQDLELKIITPVLGQLEQQLEILLTKAGILPEDLSQIICSGGANSSLYNSCSSLLKNKYPKAGLVQDGLEESELAVAIGLSRLPLFPKIIDYTRHQYSDYFLLLELLEALPSQEFSFEEILRRLSWRGINTRVCSERILGFLHGNFPPGLFFGDNNLFSNSFFQNTPVLFTEKEGFYLPNSSSCQDLRQYLTRILSHTRQTLTEPLIVDLSL